MKKLICFLCFAIHASALLLPDTFQIVERVFSLTTTFDVKTEKEILATARKRFLALAAAFDLEGGDQQLLATANSRFFSWGTVADIADGAGSKIGWIEEELFRILPWGEYRVFNSLNQIVAIAKMNFWGTYFELTPPDNGTEVYATMSRPLLRFYRDYWTVEIKNRSIFEEGIIDPRLLIILAIYQTDKDNRDRLRNEIFNRLQQDLDSNNGFLQNKP